MVYAQVQRAIHTGRYRDGLRVADELMALARNEESVLVGEALLPLSAIYLCWGPGRRPGQRRGGDPPGQAKRSTRTRDPPRILLATSRWLQGTGRLPYAALSMTWASPNASALHGVRPSRSHLRLGFVRRGRLDEAADRVSEARRLFGRWSAADRHVLRIWISLRA